MKNTMYMATLPTGSIPCIEILITTVKLPQNRSNEKITLIRSVFHLYNTESTEQVNIH